MLRGPEESMLGKESTSPRSIYTWRGWEAIRGDKRGNWCGPTETDRSDWWDLPLPWHFCPIGLWVHSNSALFVHMDPQSAAEIFPNFPQAACYHSVARTKDTSVVIMCACIIRYQTYNVSVSSVDTIFIVS